MQKINKAFTVFCKDLKLKENRFVSYIHFCTFKKNVCVPYTDFFNVFVFLQCYYLGGTDDAATGILGEMSKPLSWGMPVEKVCEKLKKKDKQICELRYGE